MTTFKTYKIYHYIKKESSQLA